MKLKTLGLLAASGLLLAAACSTSRLQDQMKIGLWASRQNLWNEAIYRWRRILDLNPNSAAAHNNLAVAYETKGMWDEARREYDSALKLDPKNSAIKSNFEQFQKNLEVKKPEDKKKETHAQRP
jgi:Flp pilus assembly protein TadD